MYTLQELERIVKDCEACRLSKTRNHVVFGEGAEKAAIMFIGEGPGYYEDQTGKPFVGRAGKLLDQAIEGIGFSRPDIYIGNIVKCRPPDNRNPLEDEMKACLPYLRYQFKLIQPRIVVCLGAVAANQIIHPGFKITKEHGLWFERKGFNMMGVYHPAAVLRDDSKKRDFWNDFLRIKKKYNELMVKGD